MVAAAVAIRTGPAAFGPAPRTLSGTGLLTPAVVVTAEVRAVGIGATIPLVCRPGLLPPMIVVAAKLGPAITVVRTPVIAPIPVAAALRMPTFGPVPAALLAPPDFPITVMGTGRRAEDKVAAVPRAVPEIEPHRIEHAEPDVGEGGRLVVVVLDQARRPAVLVATGDAEALGRVGVDDSPLGGVVGVAPLEHDMHEVVGLLRPIDQHRALAGKIVGHERPDIRPHLRGRLAAAKLHHQGDPAGGRQGRLGIEGGRGRSVVFGHATGGSERETTEEEQCGGGEDGFHGLG